MENYRLVGSVLLICGAVAFASTASSKYYKNGQYDQVLCDLLECAHIAPMKEAANAVKAKKPHSVLMGTSACLKKKTGFGGPSASPSPFTRVYVPEEWVNGSNGNHSYLYMKIWFMEEVFHANQPFAIPYPSGDVRNPLQGAYYEIEAKAASLHNLAAGLDPDCASCKAEANAQAQQQLKFLKTYLNNYCKNRKLAKAGTAADSAAKKTWDVCKDYAKTIIAVYEG